MSHFYGLQVDKKSIIFPKNMTFMSYFGRKLEIQGRKQLEMKDLWLISQISHRQQIYKYRWNILYFLRKQSISPKNEAEMPHFGTKRAHLGLNLLMYSLRNLWKRPKKQRFRTENRLNCTKMSHIWLILQDLGHKTALFLGNIMDFRYFC